MSCTIDSSVYFYGLLFASGVLIAGYRTAIDLLETSKLLTAYEARIKLLTAENNKLTKENIIREFINDPSVIREILRNYEDTIVKNELTTVEEEHVQTINVINKL